MALDAVAVARAFEVMLPAHKGKLMLEHNPHRECVGKIDEMDPWWLKNYLKEQGDELLFINPIERQKADATGELWVLDWWAPDGATPRMAAATLPALAQWLQDNGLAFGS